MAWPKLLVSFISSTSIIQQQVIQELFLVLSDMAAWPPQTFDFFLNQVIAQTGSILGMIDMLHLHDCIL